MINYKKQNAITIIVISIVIVTIALFAMLESVDPLFSAVLVLWGALFAYSIINYCTHITLCFFLFSFFVLLLGRVFCYEFFDSQQIYNFLDETNQYTFICLVISLVGLWIGYQLSNGKYHFSWRCVKRESFLDKEYYGGNYAAACKIMFFACFAVRIIGILMQIVYVRRVGYVDSYSLETGGAGIPMIVVYIGSFAPISLCMFLATKPQKRETTVPLILYWLYGALTLLTGQRYPFVGITMFILIYMFIRNKTENGWIKKGYYVVLIIAIPFLIFGLTAYNSIRQGYSFAFQGLGKLIEEFFIQQGGSINVIRRTIFNAPDLEDLHLVSFSSTYSTLFENAIVKRILGITVYSGNSMDAVRYSHNISHRLSYLAYGTAYFSGRGTGSSYIAELLHDFGPIGVVAGNIFYGYIIGKIDKITFNNKFKDAIKLAIIYYIILAPRGSFDAFIGAIFNIYSIIGFIAILFISRFIKEYRFVKLLNN